MPATSDTGHAKNVANFESLILFCLGYHATYNPSNSALKVASLQTLLLNAANAVKDCKTAETSFDNATGTRKFFFAGLKVLCTRIVNALSVSGVAANVVAGARTINRKIQGQRAGGAVTAPAAPALTDGAAAPSANALPATISSAQQSFDNLVEHFNGLIELVSSHTAYNPNEADLTTVTLQSNLTTLNDANTTVKTTNVHWSNTRINRDALLYAGNTGLVATAINVKGYIKSVFGASSAQYTQVKGIRFKIIMA